MNASGTEEFRVRIDRKLAREARRVAEEIGTTPGEVVRLLFTQLVKRRHLRPAPWSAPCQRERSVKNQSQATPALLLYPGKAVPLLPTCPPPSVPRLHRRPRPRRGPRSPGCRHRGIDHREHGESAWCAEP